MLNAIILLNVNEYAGAMIKWLEKNRIFPLIITILIAIEIFYFSSRPGGTIGTGGNAWTSIVYHFVIFFLFTFFLFISIKGNQKIKIKYISFVIIISIIYAILDEFHQLFVPLRSFSIKDILTDIAGILSSIILILIKNN